MSKQNIVIVLKTRKNETEHESIEITRLSNAKKVYRKLLKEWNKKKVVSLPTHCFALASDLIHSIGIEEM